MRTGNNKPYVKRFDVNGVCINPITAANPYVSKDSTRRTRRDFMQKDSSSKKNTPNKRRQVVFLDTVTFKKKEKVITLVLLNSGTKIIHHERKG